MVRLTRPPFGGLCLRHFGEMDFFGIEALSLIGVVTMVVQAGNADVVVCGALKYYTRFRLPVGVELPGSVNN